MPTKEYQCLQCGHYFKRVLFPGDEEKKLNCPKCKSLSLERLRDSAGLFKGISNFSALARDSN